MDFNQETRIFKNIFVPGYIKRLEKIERKNKRFVYYTSAEVVFNILKKQRIWLRNATTMNDFSEIGYGIQMIHKVLDESQCVAFKNTLNSIFPGTFELLHREFYNSIDNWKLETYITCISRHRKSEDQDGRLSMWRAYGDTALVVKNTPLVQVTDQLSVYGAPVRYFYWEDYWRQVLNVMGKINANKDLIIKQGQNFLIRGIYEFFFMTAITTKHPGFKEEREWRIYYRPTVNSNVLLEPEDVVVNNVPQQIFKLPLIHNPAAGLVGADIPNLLDRIIIGPSQYRYVAHKKYCRLLEELGVVDPVSKVHVSSIPLRTQ